MKTITSKYIEASQWPEAFASLSEWEKRVMVVIARGACNRSSIAINALITPVSADNSILHLAKVGLIAVERAAPAGNLYKIVEPEMVDHCNGVSKAFVWDSAIEQIAHEVYSLTAKRFEALEHLGLIVGNGHHMAQKASNDVKSELKKRWRNQC
jgi:hypothetical protein